MGVEYYAFSLFVFGLLCVIAFLCKMLFADVRRQNKLLDEKETKLLKLFQAVESIMEEFNDQVKAATEELKEYEIRARKSAAALQQSQPPEAEAASMPTANGKPADEDISPKTTKSSRSKKAESGRMKAAGEALERAEKLVSNGAEKKSPQTSGTGKAVFQRIIDETVGDTPEPEPEVSPKQTRTNTILEMQDEGKTITQIAKKLGITQNEVKLVIGLRASVSE